MFTYFIDKICLEQVQGLWKTKTQNMTELCKVAKELKDKFSTFEINHVERVHITKQLCLILQYTQT